MADDPDFVFRPWITPRDVRRIYPRNLGSVAFKIGVAEVGRWEAGELTEIHQFNIRADAESYKARMALEIVEATEAR